MVSYAHYILLLCPVCLSFNPLLFLPSPGGKRHRFVVDLAPAVTPRPKTSLASPHLTAFPTPPTTPRGLSPAERSPSIPSNFPFQHRSINLCTAPNLLIKTRSCLAERQAIVTVLPRSLLNSCVLSTPRDQQDSHLSQRAVNHPLSADSYAFFLFIFLSI